MDADLVRRRVRVGETCATVIAAGEFQELAERAIRAARADIEAYAAGVPRFLSALEPLPVDMAAPPVVRRMAAAARLAGVGPMAAVAGAIAQEAVEALAAAGCRHAVVDNGGDVVLRIDRPVTLGVFTGDSPVRDIALRCTPRPGIFSVCTSSGTVGHSLSFGRADAALVVAEGGALADAMATALGNRVAERSGEAVARAIRETQAEWIEGVLVVAGEHLGTGGSLPPLVRAPVDWRLASRG